MFEELSDAIERLPASLGSETCPLRMEDLIDPVLRALPDLLKDQARWKSLYIDYEPPFLMRIYLPFQTKYLVGTGDKTIYISLHYFFGLPSTTTMELPNPYTDHPAMESLNNYHPHPWAAAFLLLEGSYRQDIGMAKELGYSSDPNSPLRPIPFATWEQDADDPTKNRYAFNDQLIWHRVLPNEGLPVASLMVTYIPKGWEQVGPRPPTKQRELTERERGFMFSYFEKLISKLV